MENNIESINTIADVKENKMKSLQQQIDAEYVLAWKHQKPKKDEWNIRLKLYNNQKRDKSSVGDTTLFTITQTVLASLYSDRLNVTFEANEEGDEPTAENLNELAEFDYDQMQKATIDYDWDFDTAFFGHGLLAMEEFVRDPDNNIFIPAPQVIDPMLFLRDPNAVSVNGDFYGKGAMRFGGYEIKMTKQDMLDNPHFIKEELNFNNIYYGDSIYSIIKDAKEARDYAQGRQPTLKHEGEINLGDNAQYTIVVWYTHAQLEGDTKPEKYKVWLANDRQKIVGLQKITRKFYNRTVFPIIDRFLYPMPHDWDGVSIPDLVEDKQRARAVAQNLGLKAMKADLYPMYIYDSNRIRNRNDLSFDYNKFIPADIPEGGSTLGAVTPLQKSNFNLNLLDFVYNSLDVSAQKATATPEIQQGVMSDTQRTLGELNLIAGSSNTRYSLSAKVFGWSEKQFWTHWYYMYDEYFNESIDEKVLRIRGAFGAKWRKVKKGDITATIMPDIRIESTALNRAKELEDRQQFINYLTLAIQDPTINRRYAFKHFAKLSGMDYDQIDRMFPPTIDERIALQQNELLNDNLTVPVLPEDDHNAHLEIHAQAKPTDATYAHIETHKRALAIKKTRPDLFPATQDVDQINGQANLDEAGRINTGNMSTRATTQGVQQSSTSNVM